MADFAKAEVKVLQEPNTWCARLAKFTWNWRYFEGWQQQVILSKERFNILNCCRQAGKSHTLMLRAVHRAIAIPKALELVVAEQRQSNENLRRARDLCKTYNDLLYEHSDGKIELSLVTDNKTSLELANGSRIIALPANEKVRGYANPTDIYIDEAARLDDEVFIGLEPMITTGTGNLFLASTPNGAQGFFYHEWLNPRYTLRLRIPWSESERLRTKPGFKEQIERSRTIYGDAYVKQEYCCEFLEDISSLFSEETLKQSMDESEEVFTDEMEKINKTLQGDALLV